MLGKPRLDTSRGSSANNSRTSRAAEVLWHANREDLGTVRWIGEDFRDALGVHVGSLSARLLPWREVVTGDTAAFKSIQNWIDVFRKQF